MSFTLRTLARAAAVSAPATMSFVRPAAASVAIAPRSFAAVAFLAPRRTTILPAARKGQSSANSDSMQQQQQQRAWLGLVLISLPLFCSSLAAAPAASSSLLVRRVSSSSSSLSPKVERPISPHVTVYDFPVPALSSITNRATGVGLSIGVMSMGFVALGGGCDIPSYVECVKTSAPILMPLLKMVVAFPIVYHSAAGVRHIFWDKTARGLDLPSVEMSSKAIIAGSVVVSFLLGFYTLPALKK